MTAISDALPATAGEHATVTQWRRHPADLARLVVALAALGVGLLVAWAEPESMRRASTDLVRLFRQLPDGLEAFLVGVVQLVALVVPAGTVVLLVHRRRWRLLGTALVAAAVAGVAMALMQGWLDRQVPPIQIAGPDESWVGGREFPSGAYLASLTAAVVVLASSGRTNQRRLGFAVVGLAMLARVITAEAVPLNVWTMASLGAVVGSAALWALGGPVRRLGLDDLASALARAGLAVTGVRELPLQPRRRRTFAARTAGGDDVVVKLVDADERDAQLLFRALRRLRVKSLDDERPGWDPEHVVDHEALTSLLAEQAGVRVPAVLAATAGPDGQGVIAMRDGGGRALDEISADEVSDDLLDDAFRQLTLLHGTGIAHRQLSAGNLVVRPDGAVGLIDFRTANRNAEPALLEADVAQLLVCLAELAGTERAVAAAVREVPLDRLRASLAYVQPVILPDETRDALGDRKARKAFLVDLRDRLKAATGAEDVKLAPIARLTVGNLVSLFGGLFLLLVVIAFASRWSSIWDALQQADWSKWPELLFWTVVLYVSGAISLIGAVPRPLPFVPTTEIMLAQSYLNRFTPANAGGMAMRVRYLQVRGIDPVAGAASVGLTSLAGGVMQVVFLLTFALWAGSSNSVSFDLPDVNVVAVVVVLVVVLAAFFWLTPWGRRALRAVVPKLRQVWEELKPLTRQPVKAVLLFSGAGLGKLANIAAFAVSCAALGIGLPFPQLGLLYMTANTVASAAPTPGGLGAMEAALTAALTGAGVDGGTALAAVLVFRLFTYWLPVPFSYLALWDCRRREYV